MKHTLILIYRNLEPQFCPIITYSDGVAIPDVGEGLSYGPNEEAQVTRRRFHLTRDEVRITLHLDGDGLEEDPITH